MRVRYDYRGADGIGYIIEMRLGGGWRWFWYDLADNVSPEDTVQAKVIQSMSDRDFEHPWEALRNAANDWDENGSTETGRQNRAHTMRRVASGLEKRSWNTHRGPGPSVKHG